MAHPDQTWTGPEDPANAAGAARPAEPTPSPVRIPPGSLDSLADRVATGELALPAALDPDDERRLIELIRRSRRDRLVRYLARAIAHDLRRGNP